jgi:hypothetical protein
MGKRVTQLLKAAAAPVLTVGCTWLVADILNLGQDLEKAIGAALAGVLLFVAIEVTDELPKRSRRWRRRIDPRAAFEGWWLQIHDGWELQIHDQADDIADDRAVKKVDRVAIFLCRYVVDGDTYRVEGHAFGSTGDMVARWESTQVFFSTGALRSSYLWEGTSFESRQPTNRRGTTDWSVQRSSSGRVLPTSGHGEVMHLNQDRRLFFRVQRLTSERIQSLLGRAVELDALADDALQKELALAYLDSIRPGSPSLSRR